MSKIKRTHSKKLPEDVLWCKENIATLTAKAFFEQFGYTDSQKAARRYSTVLQKYLNDNVQGPHLTQEFAKFKASDDYKKYW